MKRLCMLIALAIAFSATMQAQIINDRNTGELRLSDEHIIINPDTLFMAFHGCSPYGEILSISNPTDELMVIDRFYSNDFYIECLYNGTNIADDGWFLSPGETLEVQVFGNPIYGKDYCGELVIETEYGDFHIGLVYVTNFGLEENAQNIGIYPNPADDYVTINGENLGNICIYNALGKIVDEFYSEEKSLRINTLKYENGIYFIKMNGIHVRCLVITHK